MLAVGSRVGDYEVEALVGTGGMATVYRARHIYLGSRSALKVLEPRYRDSPEVRQRFLEEARIQHTHLEHPNIVRVTNIVATPEHAALVMELVEGGSVEDEVGLLRERPEELRAIMLDVLAAVGQAHAAGIVHRDLKPANVLLDRRGGRVTAKVTDFGIAKLSGDLASAQKRSTHGDARMGTLGYMSPEQIRRAKDVTPRADIFSLGVLLYELATGAAPFDADNDYDVMDAVMHGRYVPPEQRWPAIAPQTAAVIRRALRVDPAERFASCEEMAAALRVASSAGDRPRTRVATDHPRTLARGTADTLAPTVATPAASTVVPARVPAGLRALGYLSATLGAAGFALMALVAVLAATDRSDNDDGANVAPWVVLIIGAELVAKVLLFAAGRDYLRGKARGRRLGNWYATLSLSTTLAEAARGGSAEMLIVTILPIATLVLVNHTYRRELTQ